MYRSRNEGKLRILYLGSCWPTNIGNGFVNLGAIESLRLALGDHCEIFHWGGMSAYLASRQGRIENDLSLGKLATFDYVVIAGMTQCVECYRAHTSELKDFFKNGAKLIVAGGSGQDYNEAEVKAVREYMKDLPIRAFVSRDTYAAENYGDCAEFSYDGIDSAFFVSNVVKPIPFSCEPYVVLNFDNMQEPALKNVQDRDVAAPQFNDPGKEMLKSVAKRLVGMSSNVTIDIANRRIVRSTHSVMEPYHHNMGFERPNTLISDLPMDYLHLYANAEATYSDRVHACIATLSLGNKAQYFNMRDGRIRMFDRVGVGNIREELVKLDPRRFTEEKNAQLEFYRQALLGKTEKVEQQRIAT